MECYSMPIYLKMRCKAFNILVILVVIIPVASGQESISLSVTEGCDTLQVEFSLETTLQQSDYNYIEWDFGDGGTAEDSLVVRHRYSSVGAYNVTCTLNRSRVITTDEQVRVYASPYAEIQFRDSTGLGTDYSYVLFPAYYLIDEKDTLEYEWRLPDGTTSSDSSILFTFAEEGIYPVTLELTNRSGCTYLASRSILIAEELLIPNFFSPNNDQINDRFIVTTSGEYSYTTRIYNRSGLQVYFSESTRISWDGRTSSGQEVPSGIYYYVIHSNETPVETKKSGLIHLYR